jgi:segregation and condensation protein A
MAEAEPALAPVGADAASPAPGDGSPVVIDQVALARLYGEPLFALPQDLYIPPDALEVFLEAFEGPLDLIEIKSRMLLPPKKQEGGEEAEDPRAELVRRLLEYEQIKLAAHQLGQVPHYGRDFLRAQIHIEQSLQPRFPDVDVAELQSAWRDILKRAKLVQSHKITREELSVREYMSQVLKALQGRRFVEFETLFQPEKGSTVLVVTFIAMLELAKETLIEITQAEAFAPIYVRLAYTPV